MEEIERLQDNLLLIRKATGWSATELGDKIGVTRQTINNLESKTKKYKLNKTQYIALRSVFDAEINKSPEDTKMLVDLLDMLIDNPDKYDAKDKENLLKKANMIIPSILEGTTSRKDVSDEFESVMKNLGIVIGSAVGVGAAAWLVTILKQKK